MLAAGLDGIERKLDPGPQNTAQPLHGDRPGGQAQAHQGPADDARRRHRARCARTPCCATGSATPAREHYSDYFADTKLAEFQSWHSQVSQWEVDRYLTLF